MGVSQRSTHRRRYDLLARRRAWIRCTRCSRTTERGLLRAQPIANPLVRVGTWAARAGCHVLVCLERGQGSSDRLGKRRIPRRRDRRPDLHTQVDRRRRSSAACGLHPESPGRRGGGGSTSSSITCSLQVDDGPGSASGSLSPVHALPGLRPGARPGGGGSRRNHRLIRDLVARSLRHRANRADGHRSCIPSTGCGPGA